MEGIDRPTVVWFAKYGCVVREGERRTVVIAKQRVGSWEPGERRIRNALMVQFAADPTIIFEELARAFEVSSETLRVQRRLFEAKGLGAVLAQPEPHHKGGRPIEPALRRQMERLFAQGKSVGDVAVALAGQVKYGTVEKYRRLWKQKQAKLPRPAQQRCLPLAAPPVEVSATQEQPAATEPACAETCDKELPSIRAPRTESERVARAAPIAEATAPEREGVRARIGEFTPFSEKGVQHVGAWLLLVTIAGLGLYSHLREHQRRRPAGRPLRVAIDAVLVGLAIGGRCVESVRRLATSSVAAMLLAESAPSATWVRRTLGGYCAGEEVSQKLLEDVSGELLREVRDRTPKGEPVVLFIDNHGRQYTGRHLLRRIWRMQDKRTVPGAMDYWVHDVEGRPVLVIPVEPGTSLPETIRSKVAFLREKLGPETPLLLVFDRAGAFPGLWKWLRDNGVEFVTYQRASYRKFSREWFDRCGKPMTLREADGQKIEVMVQAGQMNLGKGRGRIRRIRLLMPGDAQLNVVAWSSKSDQWLCQKLFIRWRQENGLKHGVERWGLNQLDGRQVEEVPSGTLVTNPNRTNLDHLLRDDKQRERAMRLQLQQLYPGHPQRPELKQALAANRAAQREILKARHQTPKKLPIEQTELKGELKQHTREYKLLIDTLRCTAQYAEAELAAVLALHMARPDEAKRLLQNVFSSPGDVQVTDNSITVSLAPAANRAEQPAIEALFHAINQRRLCHPGDPLARPMRFRLQIP
jgi:hypothetical protein